MYVKTLVLKVTKQNQQMDKFTDQQIYLILKPSHDKPNLNIKLLTCAISNNFEWCRFSKTKAILTHVELINKFKNGCRDQISL